MDENEKKVEATILKDNENNETFEEKTEEKKEENLGTEDNEKFKKIEEQNVKNEFNKNEFQNNQKTKKKKGLLITSIIVIVILILISIASTILAVINMNNNNILGGISIGETLVEGLTEEDAINILNKNTEEQRTKEITLQVNGSSFSITPEQIETKFEVEKAVEKAYKIGRNGNIFENNFAIFKTIVEKTNIQMEVTYNEELLAKFISDLNGKIANAMVDNTYYIEDNQLIITRGIAGLVINEEDAKNKITAALNNPQIETVEIATEYKECPQIDIDKIHDEVKTEPQNASYTTNPFTIIPHKNGIDFDLESARNMLQEEKEEYSIKLIITRPEVLTSEIGEEAFPDLLSSFSTKYDESNVPRSKNLKIAMSKLNGAIVMPGEVFSYNKTLGKRTIEAGYQYANGFAGGKVVPMLAGGICQISSTLYDAVLYANLNIVERHNHMFQATYVEPGKDATVVYGSLDFKFENTRKNPIMIKTKCSAGLAEIKIFGIKEEVEYDVEIVSTILSTTPYKVVYKDDATLSPGKEKVAQYGLKGCKSITYRIVKLNGQEVSKEVLSTDTYSALNKIIKRGKTQETNSSTETSTTPENTTTPSNTTTNSNTTTTPDTTTNTTTNTNTTTIPSKNETLNTNTTQKTNTIGSSNTTAPAGNNTTTKIENGT